MSIAEHPEHASLRSVLDREFDVVRLGRARLAVHPRRKMGSSGLLRLLLPRAVAVVSGSVAKPHVLVRPDGLAIFMGVVSLGAVLVESTMDRALYPRESPAAFVYALAGWYLVASSVAVWRTRQEVTKAIRTAAGS